MADRPWDSGIRPWGGQPLCASLSHKRSWDNHDLILGVLFGIAPEVVVLSGSFQDELSIMRTRHLWPHTVHAVVAVAAGVGAFSTELAQIADGVLGSSQWEPGATFPNTVEPTSHWFLHGFQRQFAANCQRTAHNQTVTDREIS